MEFFMMVVCTNVEYDPTYQVCQYTFTHERSLATLTVHEELNKFEVGKIYAIKIDNSN